MAEAKCKSVRTPILLTSTRDFPLTTGLCTEQVQGHAQPLEQGHQAPVLQGTIPPVFPHGPPALMPMPQAQLSWAATSTGPVPIQQQPLVPVNPIQQPALLQMGNLLNNGYRIEGAQSPVAGGAFAQAVYLENNSNAPPPPPPAL